MKYPFNGENQNLKKNLCEAMDILFILNSLTPFHTKIQSFKCDREIHILLYEIYHHHF